MSKVLKRFKCNKKMYTPESIQLDVFKFVHKYAPVLTETNLMVLWMVSSGICFLYLCTHLAWRKTDKCHKRPEEFKIKTYILNLSDHLCSVKFESNSYCKQWLCSRLWTVLGRNLRWILKYFTYLKQKEKVYINTLSIDIKTQSFHHASSDVWFRHVFVNHELNKTKECCSKTKTLYPNIYFVPFSFTIIYFTIRSLNCDFKYRTRILF